MGWQNPPTPDELGLADNTLVIFTSDHGEMLGDHGMHGKGVFYEGSAHVPLLMRLPGVIPATTVISDTRLTDWICSRPFWITVARQVVRPRGIACDPSSRVRKTG